MKLNDWQLRDWNNDNYDMELPTLKLGVTLDNLQSAVFHKNDTPRLDAQVLMANVMGKPRSWVLAHPEAPLTPEQQTRLSTYVNQLETSVPLPYVIGHWEFFNLDFDINPHVLIPRPETELLVEAALEWLVANPHARRIADIGTGSGCISVSLAHHIPDLHVTATDISEAALEVAHSNAIKHGVSEQISLIHTDLLPPTDDTFNLICANLPYIPTKTLHQLDVYRREPTLALDGGHDGLKIIRKLVYMAPKYLASRGAMMLEIEANHGKTAIELATKQFPDSEIKIIPDLAGHDRLLIIQT
jgi:release factor glutamine methyltransferase